MSFTYLSLLRPTTTERLPIDNQSFAIPKTELQLRCWTGLPLPNTFGNKPLIDFGGRPLFARVVRV